MDYLYFPTTMIVSMLYIMENGATAEIGVVGNDRLIGNALLLAAKRRRAGRSFKARARLIE